MSSMEVIYEEGLLTQVSFYLAGRTEVYQLIGGNDPSSFNWSPTG